MRDGGWEKGRVMRGGGEKGRMLGGGLILPLLIRLAPRDQDQRRGQRHTAAPRPGTRAGSAGRTADPAPT